MYKSCRICINRLTKFLASVTAAITVPGRLLIVVALITASLLSLTLPTASLALEPTALGFPLLIATGAAVPRLWSVLILLGWSGRALVGLSLVLMLLLLITASRLVAVVARWSGVVVSLLVVVGEPRRALSLLLMTESSVLMKASVTLSVVAVCEMEAKKTSINSIRRVICKLRLCLGWGRN